MITLAVMVGVRGPGELHLTTCGTDIFFVRQISNSAVQCGDEQIVTGVETSDK